MNAEKDNLGEMKKFRIPFLKISRREKELWDLAEKGELKKFYFEHEDEIMELFFEYAERMTKAFSIVKKATIHYEQKEKKNER